jgi:ABC-type transport system involved in multi-copper enzyme maturation permease subunit
MNATIAAQMTGADFLKLRKRRGTTIWALAVAVFPLLVFFIVRAAQHSSNPVGYGPAGGTQGFIDAIRIIGIVFGPLAGILIGSDAGAGDHAAGVFRDLVVTGRSRIALFATRVPAAIALTWLVASSGYALAVLGTFAFAGSGPTPDSVGIVNGLLFTLLSTGAICAIAVGFSSLTASRPSALVALIGWQLIASPLLASIGSLGSARDLLLREAISHFSPVNLADGHGPSVVSMGLPSAVFVLIAWLLVFLGLGAWRTRSMDT